MSRLEARRVELGLELQGVADELMIPIEHLTAIEQGRFDALPEGPYARGWARAYCAHLNVDPEPTLAAMEPAAAPAPLVPVAAIRAVAALAAVLLLVLIGSQAADLLDDGTAIGTGGEVVADAPTADQRVKITVERPGYFRLVVDGETVVDRRARPGEVLDVSGDDRIEVHLPAAESARVEYNGELVVPQGRQDAPRRLVFIDDLEG